MAVQPRPEERADGIVTVASQLWVRRGRAPAMVRPHRHDDLEINLVLAGRLDYLFGGSRVSVVAGQMALFWAATAHRLIDQGAQQTSDVCWAHVPLTTVLGWSLPSRDLSEILLNRMIVVPADVLGREAASMFESWRHELDRREDQDIALLEVHALVRRALRHQRPLNHQRQGTAQTGEDNPSAATAGNSLVTAMARFMVVNFREAISMANIAEAVHLNPNYAMTLFRETVGTTMGSYLTRCRIAEAQRLLITTSMTTISIGQAAGFGSQSSFYEHFAAACGSTPAAYRRRLR